MMDNSKTLQMTFTNSLGKKMTLSINDPKEDLQKSEVESAMNEIIGKNIFNSNGADLVAISGARIVDREVTELIEN